LFQTVKVFLYKTIDVCPVHTALSPLWRGPGGGLKAWVWLNILICKRFYILFYSQVGVAHSSIKHLNLASLIWPNFFDTLFQPTGPRFSAKTALLFQRECVLLATNKYVFVTEFQTGHVDNFPIHLSQPFYSYLLVW
jgi:hypothetical protein